jgi:hypothetical protein
MLKLITLERKILDQWYFPPRGLHLCIKFLVFHKNMKANYKLNSITFISSILFFISMILKTNELTYKSSTKTN